MLILTTITKFCKNYYIIRIIIKKFFRFKASEKNALPIGYYQASAV